MQPSQVGRRDPALLDVDEVAGYLHDVGMVTQPDCQVRSLEGGVSSGVFAVRVPDRAMVVKQALPQLRVSDRWEADPARAVREGLALRILHELTPDAVPECLHVDAERCVVVIPHAPDEWTDWKSRLLAGDADPAVAQRLGRLLATWHTATRGSVPDVFYDRTTFDELRLDPYYRTVMARRPDLAPPVEGHLDRLLTTQECLVHGDFSPKNVLLGEAGLWVVDMEVAHVGDPAFDVAFLLSHLLLKSVYRPSSVDDYRACGNAFVDAYAAVAGPSAPAWRHVVGHVGCLLLARVVGKSPVEYLGADQGRVACAAAEHVLTRPPVDVEDLWLTLETEVS